MKHRPFEPAPAVQEFLEEVRQRGNDLDSMLSENIQDVRTARESWALHFLWHIPVDSVHNALASSRDRTVWVRIYQPQDRQLARRGRLPIVIYFHGGGWALGSLGTYDSVCRELTRKIPAIVISVDYRLAPENAFPAAVEDAQTAVHWAQEHAESMGGDPERIAIAGDSAGGTLAIVAALINRERNGPPLAMQVLFYPSTNISRMDYPSYGQYGQDHLLTSMAVEAFAGFYLPNLDDRSSPYASPLLAPNLSGLPPALIVAAGCDPLRDEGKEYAARLEQAGVAVTYHMEAAMIHGFLSLYNLHPKVSPYAEATLSFTAGVMREMLRPR